MIDNTDTRHTIGENMYASFYEIAEDLDLDIYEVLYDTDGKTSNALNVEWIPDVSKFLHGYCDAFALYLSRECGYNVIARFVKSEYGEPFLIHAACIVPGGYVDVRGFTENLEEMFAEFEESAEDTLYQLSGEYGEGSCWIEDVEYDTEGFYDYCMERSGDFDECRYELDEYGAMPFFNDFYVR